MGANLLFYVAPSSNPFDDDFTGDNGDPPNDIRWTLEGGTGANDISYIQDNKLRQDISGFSDDVRAINTVTFGADEDFDVQVDWVKILGPSINHWTCSFNAEIIDGTNAGWACGLARVMSINQSIRYRKYDPNQVYTQFNHSGNEGKFRITRISGFFQGYHDVGAGWVSQFPDRFFTSDGTVQIVLFVDNGNNLPSATMDWDNLISV